MEQGALPPRRIGQVALTVRDLERATAFYREALGLEYLFSAPPGLAFFRCGEVRIMLALPEEGKGGGGGTVLYYEVDDVPGAHADLVGRGARAVGEPHVVHRTESMELWMAFFEDGEGNLLALMREVATSAVAGGAGGVAG